MSYVGRTAEIETLLDYLLEKNHPLISIVGEGGIGKTSLALTVAERLAAKIEATPYSDGIWLISCAGIDAGFSSQEQLVISIATTIGMHAAWVAVFGRGPGWGGSFLLVVGAIVVVVVINAAIARLAPPRVLSYVLPTVLLGVPHVPDVLLDGLHALGKSLQDPGCSAKTLSDALVFSVSGDTFKQPFDRDGWGDGTPGGANILYVMGAGQIKTGWFGELVNNNTVRPWEIATGNVSTGNYNDTRTQLGNAAAATVLYAISKGDMRRVRDFYNGPDIAGLVNVNITG